MKKIMLNNAKVEKELILTDWAKEEIRQSEEDYVAGRYVSFDSEKEAIEYIEALCGAKKD